MYMTYLLNLNIIRVDIVVFNFAFFASYFQVKNIYKLFYIHLNLLDKE